MGVILDGTFYSHVFDVTLGDIFCSERCWCNARREFTSCLDSSTVIKR